MYDLSAAVLDCPTVADEAPTAQLYRLDVSPPH